MLRSLLPAAALLLLIPTLGHAGKVKVWNHQTPAHHDKAQLKQAVVTSEGAVRLSRRLEPLAALDASHVWDVLEDRRGNLYAATGDAGKLYKITPEGKVTIAFTAEESQLLCLAEGPDGAVYAGTGPTGRVVRVDPSGAARVLATTPEAYVWSLAVGPSGELFAGTGPKGRVYRVGADGKTSLFYQTRQEHVLCLAPGRDGILFAGTDRNGAVYRIDPKGKGFVLYHAPQGEVRSLVVTADAVYAGTSAPTGRRRPGSSGSSALTGLGSPPGTVGATPASATKLKADPSEKEPAALTKDSGTSDKEATRGTPAAAVPPPGSGENSLYRIANDGTAREIFREKALVLRLLRDSGRVFVGTGMDGQLFEVDETTRERTEVARLDHGQILSLCRRRDGSLVVGTGDPGKLYVLKDRFAERGTVTSEVLDAKLVSRWGALRWRAEVPTGTSLTVAVRSGNVAEPDDTWSDWSAEQADAQTAIAAAPSARYLQYRATLTTNDPAATPALRGLTVRYQTTNQAPEVASIDVPDLDAVTLENPKKLKLKWSATDQNEDELTYDLYVRKEGWKSWVLLEEGLEKKDLEWDTTTTPSGTYRVRVVASDRRDNPDEDALTGERTSAAFVVSHEAPKVTLKAVGVEGDRAVIEATATDPWVRLTSATYTLNGRKWTSVFPADGLFDGKTESFKFKTETLKPGSYVVVLRVQDAAGNTGSGDVVFTVREKGEK